MVTAYIGVGSNIRPEQNLPRALSLLQQRVTVTSVSTIYRTAPLGRPEQADYLNAVWQIRTVSAPRVLKFQILRPIEAELGRVRTQDPYQARTIDLDLLCYGTHVVFEPDLVLPDPAIRKRAFIAIPLAELDPHLILADTHEPLQDLLAKFEKMELHPQRALTGTLQRMVRYE